MSASVFLPQAPLELRDRLQRLIDISMGAEEQQPPLSAALWSPEFFGVSESPYFLGLSETAQLAFLIENSAAILREALAIEHAGVSYAHKMADAAENQEERFYYTCVAHEELQHLRWLSRFSGWQTEDDIPFFAEMIGTWIENENRPTLLLMIQILLEGWGIHYYGTLAKHCNQPALAEVLKKILQDESRHHAGGLMLFEREGLHDVSALLPKIQSLLNIIRMGPYTVALSLTQLNEITDVREIESLLFSIQAEQSSREKLNVLQRLLSKCFKPEDLGLLVWEPLLLAEMAGLIANVANAEIPDSPKEISL